MSEEVTNNTGINPVEYKILIEPEDVEERSAGGIIMAPTVTDKEKQAQVRGRLLAVGGNAFEDWLPPVPKVGDQIMYAKYAGLVVKTKDGKELRLANDKDITAIVA